MYETQALDDLLSRTDEVVVDPNNRKVAWPLAIAGDKGYRADWIDKLPPDLDILPVTASKDIATAMIAASSSIASCIATEILFND